MFRKTPFLLWAGSAALALGLAVGCSNVELEETEDELQLQAGRTKDNVLTDNELLGIGTQTLNPTAEQIQKLLEKTPHGGGVRSVLADKKIVAEDVELPVSQAIYNAAKIGGVNPLALLVRLQLEQSLVGAKAGQLTEAELDRRLSVAFGCGCPHAPVCKTDPAAYTGFYNQLSCAVRVLKQHMDGAKSRGKTSTGWGVGTTKTTQDGVEVTPENNATAVLYTYTPYAGQDYGGQKSNDCKAKDGTAGYCAGNALHTYLWDSYSTAIRPSSAASVNVGDASTRSDATVTVVADSALPEPEPTGDAGVEPPEPPPPSGECSTDGQCAGKSNGTVCLYDYTCGCYANGDCASGKTCDLSTNRCKTGSPGTTPPGSGTGTGTGPGTGSTLPRPAGDAGITRLSDAGLAAPEQLTPPATAPRPAEDPSTRPAAGSPGGSMGYNAGNEYGDNTSYTDGGSAKKKKAAARDSGGCSVNGAGSQQDLPSSVFLVAGAAAILAGRRRRRT